MVVSKGFASSAPFCKFPMVRCEARVNNCLSQSKICCNEIFAKPRDCSRNNCKKRNWTHPSTTSKLANPARSIARFLRCQQARSFNSVLASHVGSIVLAPSFSIPRASVDTVGSLRTALTSWALLQHCSGFMYERTPVSHISTKRSTRWFEGVVSGVKTNPPSLDSCSFCRATRSAVANFLVAIPGSGDASTLWRASVSGIVCASKNNLRMHDS